MELQQFKTADLLNISHISGLNTRLEVMVTVTADKVKIIKKIIPFFHINFPSKNDLPF